MPQERFKKWQKDKNKNKNKKKKKEERLIRVPKKRKLNKMHFSRLRYLVVKNKLVNLVFNETIWLGV